MSQINGCVHYMRISELTFKKEVVPSLLEYNYFDYFFEVFFVNIFIRILLSILTLLLL